LSPRQLVERRGAHGIGPSGLIQGRLHQRLRPDIVRAARLLDRTGKSRAVTTLDLLQNLAVGIVLVCISVFVQVAVTLLVLRLFPRLAFLVERRPGYRYKVGVLVCLIITMLVGNLFQIHIWGSAFYLLSYFADFWTSQHFAAQTYTTLGYGDILLPLQRRMLAGWLALTGLLMVGWSTALFAYLVTKYVEAHEASERR
jgi:hypothetical protein